MTFNYFYISGFFAQDDPKANPGVIGALPARFGLLDDRPGHWACFKDKIEALNREFAGQRESVKVFFLGRHGEGVHNVAEARYGTPAWDAIWSKLNGDGTLVWGPDAQLTDLGVQQAQDVHNAWIDEIQNGIPIPTVFKSSPLSRAARTCEITWMDIITPHVQHDDDDLLFDDKQVVVVSENCREVYGEHTCDLRHNKTYIQNQFPEFIIEHGFTDQDELWTTERETDAHIDARAKAVLDQIWESHSKDSYVSITSHGGFISAFLRVVGRGSYGLPTGGVIPIVVKGTGDRE